MPTNPSAAVSAALTRFSSVEYCSPMNWILPSSPCFWALLSVTAVAFVVSWIRTYSAPSRWSSSTWVVASAAVRSTTTSPTQVSPIFRA